jgi:hypothetical protein
MRVLRASFLCGSVASFLLATFFGWFTWSPFGVSGADPCGRLKVSEAEQKLDAILLSELPMAHDAGQAAFFVKNQSEQTCSVLFNRASCGCVALLVGDSALNLGQSFYLKPAEQARLTLRTRLRPEAGGYSQYAEISSGEDPIQLRFKIDILDDIIFIPSVIYGTFDSEDQKLHRTVILERRFRRGAGNVVPEFVEIPPGLKITGLARRDTSQIDGELWKESWEATIELLPSHIREPNWLHVVFRDGLNAPVAGKLPITFQKSGIELPKLIYFGNIEPEEVRKRRILVRSCDGRKFDILNCNTTDPAFKVDDSSVSGGVHWLEVSFSSNGKGPHKAKLLVNTNHPNSPSSCIELVGSVGVSLNRGLFDDANSEKP